MHPRHAVNKILKIIYFFLNYFLFNPQYQTKLFFDLIVFIEKF